MSSGHRTRPKCALTSTLTPESLCPMLNLQAILCLWICKAAALFCSFKADRETGRREKDYVYFISKILLIDCVDQSPSDFLQDEWRHQILYVFLPALARHTEPLNSPRTDCPDNLASKGVKLHLTKALTELNNRWKIGLMRESYFIEQLVFANCKSNLW